MNSKKRSRAYSTKSWEHFNFKQQYIGLLQRGGSYTENACKNTHAGKKDVMQEKMTNYKLITNLLQYEKLKD